MKKVLSLILAAVCVCCGLAFAGCGGSSAKLRVINFRPEDKEFYDWFCAEFTRETGIQVVYEAVGTEGYGNLLNSRIKGRAVDVIGAQSANVLSKELSDAMLPLNDLQYHDGTNLWDNLRDSSKAQVKLGDNYLVATLNDVDILVYYKKDMVDEAGLGVTYANHAYPTTWGEFETTVYALKMKYGAQLDGIFAFGGAESWPMSMINSAVEAATVYAPDNEFYLKMALGTPGYDFGHDLYRDCFAKTQNICEFVNNNDKGVSYTRQPSNFATKNYPMMIDGSWSYRTVVAADAALKDSGKLGFFPLPANDGAAYNGFVSAKGGAGFSIVKDSQKAAEAKKFIEYHFKPEAYQKYIDFVCSAPTVKGVELTDALAASMFAFPSVVTFENRWIPGIEGVNAFREIGFSFVGAGGGTVQKAVDQMNDSYNKSAWTTAAALQDWFDMFFPGQGRG
jgi:hypothetical protein